MVAGSESGFVGSWLAGGVEAVSDIVGEGWRGGGWRVEEEEGVACYLIVWVCVCCVEGGGYYLSGKVEELIVFLSP